MSSGKIKGKGEKKNEIREILFKYKNLSHFEGGRTLEQVSRRDSILSDVQNFVGHSPEKPDVGDPSLRRGIGQDSLQKCLPASAVL